MKLVYPQIVTGADLLRGINKLNYLAPLLKRRGATLASIVNAKMYGVPSFYKIMKKYGIRPIIGLTVRLDLGEGQAVLIYVYAQTELGYRNLLKMSSAISITDEETLPLSWLEAYSAGCQIVCAMTDASWDRFRDEETIQSLQKHDSSEALYIGIARPGGTSHPDESSIEKIAEQTALPITAMYEARYILPEDAFAFKVARAIRSGEKLTEQEEALDDYAFSYLPEEAELQAWFHDRKSWLEATEKMLDACHVELTESQLLMPKFPLPQNVNVNDYLKEKCRTGLMKRLGSIDERYEKRLAYELSIIQQMDFADYFLIVEDFISFANKSNILTGPGRGSSAGSLVAFALFITDVDPIYYGLVFERFLNPERITMPDIDIDFADHRRFEVIEYVAKKYGKAYVAQISTFGTLSARAVARNVGRVFNFTTEEMNYVASLLPTRTKITLEQAYEQIPKLREWIALAPIRQEWFKTACLLEGLPRNASTHAAGVVLSPKPLVNFVPLQSGDEGIYLTQWPMGDVEAQGLLKMDFLGLRNLTLLDRIRTLIRYDKGIDLDFERIPLNDGPTYALFGRGEMTGVFQFESPGMRDTLKLISPTRFEDLFAINALFRPGPMDHIPNYARRKNGEEQIQYLHPSLEPILKETYGILVYQEQILQIFVQVAGYTMGEADLVRRAISKKDHAVLNEERFKFIQRAMQKGISEQTANEIYALIVKFADYGFPKSHAVAYALISYRLAYLKANEPAYFYAALLTSILGNTEKMIEVIQEAKLCGVNFLPPSINESQFSFTVEKGAIRVGLRSIQGINASFYEQVKERRTSGGKWTSMFDCAAALGSEYFTEKTATELIKAGAFDEFGESRGVLLASIDAAISHALFADPSDGVTSLLMASPKYSPGEPMSQMQKLAYEKEALGFYLSQHPAAEAKKELQERIMDIQAAQHSRERTMTKMVGLVIEVKKIRTKKGEQMAFVKIQDETERISCTFFPKQYTAYHQDLNEMDLLFVEGTIERRKGIPQILVQSTKKIDW